jgi:hypothetical protein
VTTDQSVELGTVTVQPSLGVKKLQAVVGDRVGLDEATNLAAAVMHEGAGCYIQAALH